jgi:hypothetical protein
MKCLIFICHLSDTCYMSWPFYSLWFDPFTNKLISRSSALRTFFQSPVPSSLLGPDILCFVGCFTTVSLHGQCNVGKWRLGKDLEGSVHGITELLLTHLPGEAERTMSYLNQVSGVPAGIRNVTLRNMCRQCYRYVNPLGEIPPDTLNCAFICCLFLNTIDVKTRNVRVPVCKLMRLY